jgi:hypothetical protein
MLYAPTGKSTAEWTSPVRSDRDNASGLLPTPSALKEGNDNVAGEKIKRTVGQCRGMALKCLHVLGFRSTGFVDGG